jgi:hypothetical protein
MRRRVVFLVAVMMAVLAMAGGAALAVTIDGTRGDDWIRGTNAPDHLNGGAGKDSIYTGPKTNPPGTSSMPVPATTWSGLQPSSLQGRDPLRLRLR